MNESLARCPRCAGEFHCGAADPSVPCACKAITLEAPALAVLRERYAGCLCEACLREIQRGVLPGRAPSA